MLHAVNFLSLCQILTTTCSFDPLYFFCLFVHSDPGHFKILVTLAILCRGSFYSASHFELMQTRFNFYKTTFKETTSHNLQSSKSQYSTPLLLTSFPFYMYQCPKVYNFFYLSTMLSLQFFSSCATFINIFQ
jgi:hypothetical protein